MGEKNLLKLAVTNIGTIAVSADGKSDAILTLEIDGKQELKLRIAPHLLAVLEAMLAKASAAQAQHQSLQ